MRFDGREGIVAPPSARRKGRRALRYAGLAVVAAVAAIPVSIVTAFMMNPLLRRLEAAWGIELTGHSGPSEWIFELVFGITAIMLFTVALLLTRRGAVSEPVARGNEAAGERRDVPL